MTKPLQAVRGMHDVLPEQTPYWQQLEATVRQLVQAYGYAEIRLPIVESTTLFERSIGAATDIVEKEMYTFADRNGDSLTLRPEGTASCLRAVLQHGLAHNQVQRLWYQGPMFRHERPQQGRYRQFQQIGVEAYGLPGPAIDAELILLSARLWQRLGIRGLTLQLNTLGTPVERVRYREQLVAYLTQHADQLDTDSQRRLQTNPLRILDSKNPALADLIAAAPVLTDYLAADSQAHFAQLRAMLDAAGVAYVINPRLVRGLDYYTRTVFEWTTDLLGAQGTVCAGGRYDGLARQLGGRDIPGIGFALGAERVLAVQAALGGATLSSELHACVLMLGVEAEVAGLALSEQLRAALPQLRLQTLVGSVKSQFRQADRSGAPLALILGSDELVAGTVTIKYLREDRAQVTITQDQLTDFMRDAVSHAANDMSAI
jgi:histidyl-tRNA synthetase